MEERKEDLAPEEPLEERAAETPSIQDLAADRWTGWQREAEALRADYPELELEREAEAPRFRALLAAGLDVRTAYEAVHLEEIKAQVARRAALERERAMTEHIRARGTRPPENGATAQNGLRDRVDVSRMTRAQRAEVARRAMRGETVTFRD